MANFPRPLPEHLLAQRAIDCAYLRRSIDSSRANDPFVTLCTHIVRDGQDCIGPFLEDMDTECRLWEPNSQLAQRRRAALEPPE